MLTSYIVHLACRTKVMAWFHLLSFTNGGYKRSPIRQTTPYTRNVSANNKRQENMERIQIYKKQKGQEIFVKIFGLLFIIYGLTFLIKSLAYGFKTETFGGVWNYVFYILQGLVLFVLGHSKKRNEKYFIQWDDSELKYMLPKDKNIETINLLDIRKITIQLFEIIIELPDVTKTLSLENVQFKELRIIKEKFEELKLDAEKRND